VPFFTELRGMESGVQMATSRKLSKRGMQKNTLTGQQMMIFVEKKKKRKRKTNSSRRIKGSHTGWGMPGKTRRNGCGPRYGDQDWESQHEGEGGRISETVEVS